MVESTVVSQYYKLFSFKMDLTLKGVWRIFVSLLTDCYKYYGVSDCPVWTLLESKSTVVGPYTKRPHDV